MNNQIYKIVLLIITLVLFTAVTYGQSAYFGGKGDGHAMAEVNNLSIGSRQARKSNPNKINVSPNPVASGGVLGINGLSSNHSYTFEVLNLTGEIVQKGHLSNALSTIQLDNIKPGIWLLKLSRGEHRYHKKIVVTGK